MKQQDMIVIDALELSNWDRDFLHLLQEGGVTCVHACCGLWENARETLSKVGDGTASSKKTTIWSCRFSKGRIS
ncbi:hypothetical protein [Salinicoccus sp. CNSTN-B1]